MATSNSTNSPDPKQDPASMENGQGPVCVSVINMKGGVGKTTIAAMLARRAGRPWPYGEGRKILAIDLDPQANLSQALMGEYAYRRFLEDKSPSIVEVFKGYQPPTPDSPAPSPLNIHDAVHSVSSRQVDLDIIPSRFDFSDNLIDSIKPDSRVLARLIAHNFQDKDLILIDCAPTESIFTQAAYHASRYILVPVKPEYFATIGFPLLNDSLTKFKKENRGHLIDVIGVVINNSSYHYSGNRGGPEALRSKKEIHEEAVKNGWHVFKSEIPFSRGFPKIMRGDFTHLGDASRFRFFASEFLERLFNGG